MDQLNAPSQTGFPSRSNSFRGALTRGNSGPTPTTSSVAESSGAGITGTSASSGGGNDGVGSGLAAAVSAATGRSKATTAFARLAQPFIGASRPSTSAGGGVSVQSPTQRTSRFMSHDLPSAALAFSASADYERTVICGRDYFKVFKVTPTGLADPSNIRLPQARKIQFPTEVKWGGGDLMVAALGNGTIALFKDGKVERTWMEHHRQVHKLAFSPVDPRIFLSASSDGTIKLWDIREKRSRKTFQGAADAVRDVQFNSGSSTEFLAGFDNGTLMNWDTRTETWIRRIQNAHNGPILSVDWHPDGKHAISGAGGRDKTVKIWSFHSDTRRNALFTINAPYAVAKVSWRPAENRAIASEFVTYPLGSKEYLIHLWDVRRPYIPARQIDTHQFTVTGLLWKSDEVLWSCGRDGKFFQHDLLYAPKPINDLNHSTIAWGGNDMFSWVSHPPIIRDKRNTPIRLDGEDTSAGWSLKDAVKDPRKQFHARTGSFTGKGMKPIVPVLPLAENEDPYVAPQTIQSAYFSQLFNEVSFKKMAKEWVTHLTHQPGSMTLKEACEHNRRVSIELGDKLFAQCWNELAIAVAREESKAEAGPEKLYIKRPWTVSVRTLLEKQARKEEKRRRRAAREAALEKQRAEAPAVTLKSPSIAASAAPAGSNSSKTTPMVTAVPNTPHQPANHGKSHGPIHDPFLLPPAAFGTSLSSSTASTDGEDSDPGITMSTLPRTVSWSDVRRMNRSTSSLHKPLDRSHSPPTDYLDAHGSSALPEFTAAGLSVIKENIPGELHPSTATTPAIPISNPRVSTLGNGNTSRHGTPIAGSARDTRGMSLGLYSERTSSSAEGPLLGESYDDKYDRFAAPAPTTQAWDKPADESDYDSSEEEDPDYKAFYEYSLGDDDLVPHTEDAEYIVREFIEEFTEVGAVQFVATLVLLVYELIEIEETGADDVISLYVDMLRRHQLHTVAAYITKHCPTKTPVEDATNMTFVYTSCGACGKPIDENHRSWYCEKCKSIQEGCVICTEVVKGKWTMCQHCGHGGHTECLSMWFFDEGVGGCPMVGCGHECCPVFC
ncbi:hypothetical protein BJ508DRAFT_410493 [Ascobolus immersus RN42]|uniref:Restriction of telomere capping protein 1 n=1 Tax=Ascobolus immersus RN42 TaxID=1160509 RepID=A0A3N4IQV1_ASCIM|nr:hypothetical protein BJ508DRAFT_410493 [Ascobolus immersus RN42]